MVATPLDPFIQSFKSFQLTHRTYEGIFAAFLHFPFNSHIPSILIFSFNLTNFHHITPIETPQVTMNYYFPPTPSALSPSLYSPTSEGVIVCGPNMSAQMPPSNSSIMFPPVNFDRMFPEAPHSSPEPAVRNVVTPEGAGC
jgi:hypothetical protein